MVNWQRLKWILRHSHIDWELVDIIIQLLQLTAIIFFVLLSLYAQLVLHNTLEAIFNLVWAIFLSLPSNERES